MAFDESVGEYFLDLTEEGISKGTSGKFAVIGGSIQYTGAPYYAAFAPLKIGADLSYVYTHPDAASVIKGYSPDLIVHPGNGWNSIKERIDYFDGIIFGPGLGRDPVLYPLFEQLLSEVKKRTDKLSMVIDADGLFFVQNNLSLLSGCSNVVLTPNHREFDRLWNAVFPTEPQREEVSENVKKIAEKLGVCVVRKGSADIISDGNHIIESKVDGSPRRCGGQGDLLSGAIACFSHWAGLRFKDTVGNPKIKLLRGAYAASRFIRFTASMTYNKQGRSMTATDMIANLGAAVKHFEPKL
ncbi:hypothetical protein FO519_003324 [Halicephalobus sp. NKZ332]|nr:hypothetical protein FO519_003324 [Halicephalobus sp. NKZ332]